MNSHIYYFEFITVFLTVYQYLSHLAGITVKLPKRTLDIIESHEEIEGIAKSYRLTRENVTSGFAKINLFIYLLMLYSTSAEGL